MKKFAQIDSNNIVTTILYVNETKDSGWLEKSFGGTWIETSEEKTKNLAGKGFIWDEKAEAFIPPQPFPSWTFNEITFDWDPPKPTPEDLKSYIWNEKKGDWQKLEF